VARRGVIAGYLSRPFVMVYFRGLQWDIPPASDILGGEVVERWRESKPSVIMVGNG